MKYIMNKNDKELYASIFKHILARFQGIDEDLAFLTKYFPCHLKNIKHIRKTINASGSFENDGLFQGIESIKNSLSKYEIKV
jgi:hypothetical protein